MDKFVIFYCSQVSSEDTLSIGTIDGVQRMLVRTKKLGAPPLKCAYAASRKAVAVAVDAPPGTSPRDAGEKGILVIHHDELAKYLGKF